MCDWVTLLYSRKLTEHCKPAIMEKIKIIFLKKTYEICRSKFLRQYQCKLELEGFFQFSHNCTAWYLHSAVCSCWVFKEQCNINSVSGIVGFLGFVQVKTWYFY
uniref:Uncharacterized protein n=1 Tax=Sus scrofa TaxID=9823 RepID=A0A4X1TZ52_PIG